MMMVHITFFASKEVESYEMNFYVVNIKLEEFY